MFLESELAEVMRANVGPLTYGETTDPIVLPVETIFTDVADRDAVLSALRSELDGGAATGLAPSSDDGQIVVSFTTTVVHAARA